MTGVEIVVVDNSGEKKASRIEAVRVIENKTNVGFGAAVNQGIRSSQSPFIAVLNDDAVAHPEWLERMVAVAESRYEIGMCAPQIRLLDGDRHGQLDSAGMLIARDASSKQKGHGEPVASYARPQQALLPSGCAALYRRDMLDEIGLFDESFFLYCEDTDLGLRGRWKLWECMYVPGAVVEHRYSHSAGGASALKAFYVERNRVFVAIKNFPLPDLALVPVFTLVRFFWHLVYLRKGEGKAAEYRTSGNPSLAIIALQAWAAVIREIPRLMRERWKIQRHGRMTPKQFSKLLASFRISERQVAQL